MPGPIEYLSATMISRQVGVWGGGGGGDKDFSEKFSVLAKVLDIFGGRDVV